MTAKRLDITIEQGTDFTQQFDLPASLNLTGARAAMQVRSSYGDPTSLLTLTTENGGLVINASTRKVKPVIDAGVAAAFYPGNYVYDLKVREASGAITRTHQGVASVSPEVTVFDFDPAGEPAFLLESGVYLLLETGGRLLLEV